MAIRFERGTHKISQEWFQNESKLHVMFNKKRVDLEGNCNPYSLFMGLISIFFYPSFLLGYSCLFPNFDEGLHFKPHAM